MSKTLAVLIVEDLESDAKLLVIELRRGGWDVFYDRVDTPEAMGNALNAGAWDLIIADYAMPCFSGPAALAMARERASHVPFILVSGMVGEETAVQAMRAGADDYLFKGDLTRLVPAVERELRDAEGRREARRLEAQLRKREAQLADAQRLAHLGTWHVDLVSGASVWSDEACRILGVDPREPVLPFDEFLRRLEPAGRSTIAQCLRDPKRSRIAEDCRLACPEIAAQVVHLRGEVRRNEQGVAVQATGMIQDITERHLVDLQLKAAKEAAESANRAKSEFLANMSHEIRTPITAIVGFADMMSKTGSDAPDKGECVQVIQRNARHLLDLINEILDLSKIEAGQMTVERIPCDLSKLLGEVTGLMRSRVAERAIEFKVTFKGAIPRCVFTDPVRLRQVLVNLLGNAAKFTEKGTIEMSVSCERTADSSKLLVNVIDSGIGMSAEHVERIFDPFTQAEESTTRKYGGTGLGLTISRRLARILGGDITVTSKLGVGSNFGVSIDGGAIQDADMLTDLTEAGLTPAPSSSVPQGVLIRGRILLAEDGRDNQRLLSTHLKMAGAQITIAENGQVAVDLCGREKFDLILMDMQMPVMDGYTAARELRRRNIKVPIIALTANAMSEDRARCLACGCNDYLTKPIDAQMLLQIVDYHIAHGAAPGTSTPGTSTPVEPATEASSGGIKSTLLDYPGMASIIALFVQDLPDEVRKLESMLEHRDLEHLRRQVHQLRGAGGGYGFPAITKAAGTAEEAIFSKDNTESIVRKVTALTETIRRIDGYCESPRMVAA